METRDETSWDAVLCFLFFFSPLRDTMFASHLLASETKDKPQLLAMAVQDPLASFYHSSMCRYVHTGDGI